MEHQELAQQWAARRFAGKNVRAIAASAGVSPSTVERATNPYGPFPLLVEVDGHLVELEILYARWVARRRAGESITSIAHSDHTTRTTIKKATDPHGPFPPPQRGHPFTPDQQQRWTQLRHAGYSTTKISDSESISAHTIETATRDGGPYPRPRARAQDLVSLNDLADLTGVSPPSTYGWFHRGLLPHPTATGSVGQPLWEKHVLDDWCDAHLTTCPQCGARALSLTQHTSKRHRSP